MRWLIAHAPCRGELAAYILHKFVRSGSGCPFHLRLRRGQPKKSEGEYAVSPRDFGLRTAQHSTRRGDLRMGRSVHSLLIMLLTAALVACQMPAATAGDVPALIDPGRNAGAAPAHFDFLPAGREGRTGWTLAEDPTAAGNFAIEQRGEGASHSLAIYKPASL